MKNFGVQLKQTIISTGVVGAIIGAVLVFGLILIGPSSDARQVALGIAPPSWGQIMFLYSQAFLIPTIGSILLFGLLPAGIAHCIGRLFSKTRGDA